MNPSASRRRADSLLEYALYAAILVMTICAAYLYRAIAQDPILSGFNRYLVAVYLVFLGASFGQLNTLYRKRKAEITPPKPKPVHPLLGLTLVQVAIVAFVFVTACVTFTWALSILR